MLACNKISDVGILQEVFLFYHFNFDLLFHLRCGNSEQRRYNETKGSEKGHFLWSLKFQEICTQKRAMASLRQMIHVLNVLIEEQIFNNKSALNSWIKVSDFSIFTSFAWCIFDKYYCDCVLISSVAFTNYERIYIKAM